MDKPKIDLIHTDDNFLSQDEYNISNSEHNLPRISEAEYQVMKIIWSNAPVSTNNVVEKLEKKSGWSPKTIQTLLARLVKKGVLDYRKDSRVFVYTPLVKKGEYLQKESDSFLRRFYDGALNSMVINFLKQDRLSEDDINELKKILAEQPPESGK